MTAGVRFPIKPEFSSTEIVRKRVKSAINDWLGSDQDARVNDFCQAVSELLNNAVEHGHCTCIEGELLLENEKAVFALTTDGVAFDPTARKTKMPDFDDKGDLPEGGYGIAIINQLTDEFSYNHLNGKNVTIIAKLFNK
jgi:anti-sigma regulatory factor (Ser/Thr protein kinase)